MKVTLVCLICSAARSGSTLLDIVVGSHSQCASLGEFSFLGKAIALGQDCSCGELLVECPSWKIVFDRIREELSIDLIAQPYALNQWDTLASTVVDHKQQTSAYKALRKLRSLICDLRYYDALGIGHHLPLPSTLSQGIRNTETLLQHVTSAWGVDLLVDSSKNVHKAIALAQSNRVEARIVYLTRDGRGVYFSRRSSGFTRSEAVRGWLNYNRRANNLLPSLVPAKKLLRLRYEDLVADPNTASQTLYEFLELDNEPAIYEIDPTKSHLVNGNDMRFKGSQKMSADQRWKTEIDAQELAWFEKNAGDMNRQLGYS